MDPACLEHRLTSTERAAFERDGYLTIPGALDASQVARLTAVANQIESAERSPDQAGKLLSVTDIVARDDALVDLVSHDRVMPKIWGLLGWNIYLYHSHIDVTPPLDPDAPAGWDVAWHQDSMRVNDEIETHPRPRLSVKVGYFLTDLSHEGRGNTLVVPGSHLHDEVDCPHDGVANPPGAIPLCVSPGTAVIIDRRIWHSRSPNRDGPARKVIWYGYSYRWLRPKDQMTVAHLYDQLDPVARQLLGDTPNNNGTYDPTDDDVPLRAWLATHAEEDARWSPHARPQSRPPAMVRGKNTGRM